MPFAKPSLKGRALKLLSQREHSRRELERKQPELLAKLEKMQTTAREPVQSYEESRARRK